MSSPVRSILVTALGTSGKDNSAPLLLPREAIARSSIGYNGKERIEISILKSQNINDVDNFLEKFERLAIMSDVPKNEWGRILTSKLDSQFDRVINAIPYNAMKDYEVIVGELRKQFALD